MIGFGGGAALDVAKAVALMASHPGDLLEYAWDHPQVRPIEQPLPHFVALPTTAGTGSEVGRSSVISEDGSHVKRIIFSPKLLARARSGSVYWNCCDRVSPRLPWSGVGHSGVGVTLSTYGIQTFTRPKAWHLRSV